jgi:hypothetical protein
LIILDAAKPCCMSIDDKEFAKKTLYRQIYRQRKKQHRKPKSCSRAALAVACGQAPYRVRKLAANPAVPAYKHEVASAGMGASAPLHPVASAVYAAKPSVAHVSFNIASGLKPESSGPTSMPGCTIASIQSRISYVLARFFALVKACI